MQVDECPEKKTDLIKRKTSECFDFQGLQKACLEAFLELLDMYTIQMELR